MIPLQFLGVYRHYHRLLVAAKGGWGAYPGQGGKHRPYPEERQIGDLAERTAVRTEHQLTDGYTARIEAGDEGRHCTRRHKGPCPVDISHYFGHRLAHIGPFVELDLYECRPLDTLGVDIFYTGYIQEMIFVIGSNKTFHLVGREAAIGLGHVDRGEAQPGKDIDPGIAD